MLATAVAAATTVLTLAGFGYYLLALLSARSFGRASRRVLPIYEPPVSILKPVKGLDPEIYASFASHCAQQYGGDYELIFGVNNLSDPAVEAVEQLREEFPERNIQLVECPEVLGTNGKVSNLVQMLPHAHYEHIVINDSDILVSPFYLRRVMAAFQAPDKKQKPGRRGLVGMVTVPYRGKAHATLGSKMEALGISTDFMAGVLTARMLEGGIRFGLGSTLAFSREALEAIGGLLPLVDYLADDYESGARVYATGYDVALSSEVVDTFVPAYRFPQFLAHQIRWSRSTRDSRKWGYAGVAFTFGLPWAFLNMIAWGFSLPSVALFVMVLVARTALALSVGVGIVGDGQVLRDWWLLLPRDLVALGIWAWSFAGDTVVWRGRRFVLKDGKLMDLPSGQMRSAP
jgi:ceramide glucosyltransferase